MVQLKQVKASGALQIIRVNTAGVAAEVCPGLAIAAGGALQTVGAGLGAVVGNAPGSGACDLQTSRSAAVAVASGVRSFAAGADNQVSGQGGAAVGERNISIDQYCFASGLETYNPFRAAAVLGAGSFTGARGAGSAQRSRFLLRGQTTNATPLVLITPTSINPRTGTAITFQIVVIGISSVMRMVGIYKLEGAFRKPSTAALIGAVTKTVWAEEAIAWDANAAIGAGASELQVTVTGAGLTSINWAAQVDLVEVI